MITQSTSSVIKNSLRRLSNNILTREDLKEFVYEHGYARSAGEFEHLISNWQQKKIIHPVEIKHIKGDQIKLYRLGKLSFYELAVHLNKNAYISHASAAFLNKLSKEHRNVVYVTSEQSQKAGSEITLDQQKVDEAFSKPQKVSNNIYTYNDIQIVLLNGMYTAGEGVIDPNGRHTFSFTGTERTLIDVVVRPAYAGGARGVLEIYQAAVAKGFFADELIGILDTIPFVYPYHQAIGFYLEKAGYDGAAINALLQKDRTIDFYLDYNIQQKTYSEKWKIYYPAEMD